MTLPRRYVLNTRNPGAPAAVVCIVRLAKLLREHGYEAVEGDWENYDRYDAVVFMAFDAEIGKAKARNPGITVILADPKTSDVADAERADFLLVSSVEQRDLFLRHNPNAFIYFMFPEVEARHKVHADGDRIVIGYHGNKVHLNAMFPHVTSALEALGRKRKVEFRPIYNIRQLGPWRMGLPDPRWVETRPVQWSPEAYATELAGCDIGIVPNSMMAARYDRERERFSELARVFLTDGNDYLVRYKYSSNPGRIYVFARLGIPVVCDFFPSGAQFAGGNEERGLLAHSPHGWYAALERLAASPELRGRLADSMRAYCDGEVSPASVFRRFLGFMEERGGRRSAGDKVPEVGVDRSRERAYLLDEVREYAVHHFKATPFYRSVRKHLLRKG